MAGFLDIRAIGKGFFDSADVLSRLSKGERRVLSKYGAYVRTDARRSIRKRKRSAAPGSPPSSHEGSLRRLIFFAYDAAARSVVIGPVPFRSKRAGAAVVPELLEYGGTAVKERVRLSGGRLVAPGNPLAKKSRGPIERTAARYAGNPFMGPAAARVRPQLDADLATLLG